MTSEGIQMLLQITGPMPPLVLVLLYPFALLCIFDSVILDFQFIHILIIIITNIYWVFTWARMCSKYSSCITAFYTIRQWTARAWSYAFHRSVVSAIIHNWTVESPKEERGWSPQFTHRRDWRYSYRLPEEKVPCRLQEVQEFLAKAEYQPQGPL